MLARTVFAGLAAAFFLFEALTYVGPGVSVTRSFTNENGVQSGGGELVGEDAPMAVTSAVRTLSVGLCLLSLAFVDWAAVLAAANYAKPKDGTEPERPNG